jgi:8-oxo-dGTP pyrophosphatase MutT (NUDIX family)
MLDLAAAAVDPFDRYDYRAGHFTASGFVVHPSGDRLLLVHHRRIGAWLQPGGHIDPEDGTALDAARREVIEETGVGGLEEISSGLVDIDVHEFPATSDQARHLHLDLRFGFVAGDSRLDPSSEVIEASWFGPAELGPLGVDRSVLRPALRLLGPNLQS